MKQGKAAVRRNSSKGALADLTAEQVASSIIAYEPIWAIGTGNQLRRCTKNV